jgi:hypothetical protein
MNSLVRLTKAAGNGGRAPIDQRVKKTILTTGKFVISERLVEPRDGVTA